MKRIQPFIPKTAILLMSIFAISSCHDHEWYYEQSLKPADGYYLKLSRNKSDFMSGTYLTLNGVTGYSGHCSNDIWGQDSELDHMGREKHPIYFLDARIPDGSSNWSRPECFFSQENPLNGNTYITPTVSDDLTNTTKTLIQVYIDNLQLNSPPTHLHLVLDSWDQADPEGTIPQKTWIVSKVVDENNQPLVDNEDWYYVTDDRMTFKKASDFDFEPGRDRSPDELDLFGTFEKREHVYGSYTFVGKTKLVFVWPGKDGENNTELTIVGESNYNQVVLEGYHNNKYGKITLVPAR